MCGPQGTPRILAHHEPLTGKVSAVLGRHLKLLLPAVLEAQGCLSAANRFVILSRVGCFRYRTHARWLFRVTPVSGGGSLLLGQTTSCEEPSFARGNRAVR